MLLVWTEAVTRVGKSIRIFRNANKVPAVGCVPVFSNVVGPTGNGTQAVLAQQKFDVLLGGGRQPRAGDVRDDGMPFDAPGKKLGGKKREQSKNGCGFFHGGPWSTEDA